MARNDGNRPMSIDAMLDMERQEVLALLENKGQGSGSSPERLRSSSPYTPRSPVRSMLDIAEEEGGSSTTANRPAPPRAPVRSMLDVDTPPQSPRPGSAQVVRSMLDTDAPAPPATKQPLPQQQGSNTTPNSPASPMDPVFKAQTAGGGPHGRSMSDASFKPVDFGPRKTGGSHDRTSQYQFSDILTHNTGQQLPKRTTTQNKRQSAAGASMGQALRSSDLSNFPIPSERGRHSSLSGRLGGHTSKSPHNRLAARSRSPATFSLLGSNKAMLDDGQVVDISSAYRRLSDANLAFSSGSLSQLPKQKRPEEAGGGRLIKDYLGPDGEHLGSSDEDDEPYSTDDEDRGRKKDPRSLNPGARGESGGSKSRSRSSRRDRKTLSLLAAAEEERTHVASKQPKYQYKSLIPDPEIKVTNTSGDTVKPSKGAVHPNTSYDQTVGSATPSVVDSDDEADMDDIKRAQKLSFSMTNILTTPDSHRAIRIIYRGEYSKIVQAAEEEHHRLRKYLVATDLSDESAHAMEWAIGTVLRDGDTLIAIYCVDEETGIVTEDGALVPDDPKAMKEQAAAINSVANAKASPAPTKPVTEFKRPSALYFRGESASTPGSSPAPGGRGERNKADGERHRAVQHVTDRVLRLLRKTSLQVRVVVEVLHCKNPKHLITEVIDLVDPTLVVIGSRGRSALKGVILGSFSNYLVTKSSVPVMVARKRLRKQSKYKKTPARQVNNLSNPTARSLANAKVD